MPLGGTSTESREYFQDLTARALRTDAFGTLCTFLRVDGMADAYWDPFSAGGADMPSRHVCVGQMGLKANRRSMGEVRGLSRDWWFVQGRLV